MSCKVWLSEVVTLVVATFMAMHPTAEYSARCTDLCAQWRSLTLSSIALQKIDSWFRLNIYFAFKRFMFVGEKMWNEYVSWVSHIRWRQNWTAGSRICCGSKQPKPWAHEGNERPKGAEPQLEKTVVPCKTWNFAETKQTENALWMLWLIGISRRTRGWRGASRILLSWKRLMGANLDAWMKNSGCAQSLFLRTSSHFFILPPFWWLSGATTRRELREMMSETKNGCWWPRPMITCDRNNTAAIGYIWYIGGSGMGQRLRWPKGP